MFLMSLESAAALLRVFVVNLVQSGDNAVAIGLAAGCLPAGQRRKAILWGVGLAVCVQILLTCVATLLIRISGLMILGGCAVYYMAYQRLVANRPDQPIDESVVHDEHPKAAPRNFYAAVRMIAIAYILVSLDNILAVAGASGGCQIHVLLLGLVSSIVFVVLLGNIIASLVGRYPWLIYISAGILAFTATRMVFTCDEVAKVMGQGEAMVAGALASAGLAPASFHLPHGWATWSVYLPSIATCLCLGYVRRRSLAGEDETVKLQCCQVAALEAAEIDNPEVTPLTDSERRHAGHKRRRRQPDPV